MSYSLRKGSAVVSRLRGNIKFPEKFKGTIVEKWAGYWKNLFIDYRQMLKDLRTDMQDDPSKALKWTALISATVALAKNNPNELDFKDNIKTLDNQVAMVSEPCLNTRAVDHLRFLNTCYNQRVIHYKNLGIVSLMYTSDVTESCDLYKAHCSYLQPTIFSYPGKIIDVGIMGRWWNLYIKTSDFDENF